MAILAVDTACGACSVALAAMDGTPIAMREEPEPSRQAERTVPMMQELMAQAGMAYADLRLLVSTLGPGSFTGLRIGMTTIKGIALVTGAPVMGLNTLEVMAWETYRNRSHAGLLANTPASPLLILLNAMRGQVYAQKFLPEAIPACAPALIDLAEIPTWAEDCPAIGGNCSAIVQEAMPHYPGALLPDTLPHARDAAMLAASRFAAGETLQPLEPLYIRKPDAKPPKPIAPL